MSTEVVEWAKHCGRCLARKSLPSKSAPLHNIKTSGPMELVCMDFLSVEPDSSGQKSILVVTDHFTGYVQAFPTNDQTAQLRRYYGNNTFNTTGYQGPEFESKLIKELTGLLGNHIPLLITHKEIHNARDLIKHY
ncbi:uncharacterized protein [Antedon mediterranea]|uniref:uncharacterized protein n=1 Tax=Antedon mediterranea TaxID=105859 RepID=UPI003AF857BD